MSPSTPPPADHRATRSCFAGPGEQGRWLWWRAAGEALLAGALVMLVHKAETGVDGRLGGALPELGVIGIVLVPARRRFPVVCVLGLAALMGAVPSVGLLTAVASYTAARQAGTPRRRVEVLLGAAALAILVGAVFAPELGVGSRPFGLALGAVLAVTTVVVPGLVGTAAGQQDRLLRALRERAAAAEEARRLADSESRLRERSRIAAEMHDLVGHRLSLVSLHAGGLEMALGKEAPELRDEAAVVRRATRDAMQELREALGVLGPLERGSGALTDATGTRADIEALVEESRSGGIPVEFTWEGPDVDARPARVRRAVHRVVLESLTNVHRYAAGAHVSVLVRHTDEQVAVQVRNGVPPTRPAAATGLGSGRGLAGLRERVALLGGSLEAAGTPGGGFAVAADIPAAPGAGGEMTGAGPAEERPGAAIEQPRRGLSALQRGLSVAVTGLLGLAGVSVMMLLGVAMVNHSRYEIAYERREPPRLGMTRQQVERAVAPDDDGARAAAAGREPPRPAATTDCMYPYPGGKPEGGRLEIVRYCFRADILIAINRFTVPLVTEPPRESRKHD
ncbi:sensor histidine kinase [Streptomyces sp. NPDC058773]|uniref:sensor histidine kinase n=1 Tax=Streptomyces sp. NPDC058773 TaxID=3346632 RepID=UPI0036CE9886